MRGDLFKYTADLSPMAAPWQPHDSLAVYDSVHVVRFHFTGLFLTNLCQVVLNISTVYKRCKNSGIRRGNSLFASHAVPLPVKIIERIAHTQITAYLESHHRLNPDQGGFRKKTFNSIYNSSPHRRYIHATKQRHTNISSIYRSN